MNNRRMKVQQFITPGKLYRKMTVFSYLKLQGAWLTRAGFLPGDVVTVEVKDQKITITPEL